MITKEQAQTHRHFHENGCKKTVGPRGGEKFTMYFWRANGACKTWKTRPNEFSLPIKFGFNGPYSYLTPENAANFHLEEDCPLREISGE